MPVAIDMHTHPSDETQVANQGRFQEHFERYFRREHRLMSLDAQAEMYRELDMLCVVFALDAERTTGSPRIPNDHIADAVRRNQDVLIGFGSVDPLVPGAPGEVRRCHDLGLRGMKFQPLMQEFFPDDPAARPTFETCAELGLPVVIHTGTTGVGAGTRGGLGVHLKYGRPIPHVDDLAADLPELTVIAAHPAWPWHDEMLAVMRHKCNVYMDLSGWSPRYLPEAVIRDADTLLQDRMLFGSDMPALSPQRWIDDFEKIGLRGEVRPKILYENAARLLGIEGDECGSADSAPPGQL
ncbi:MAG: amidohydrolase [Acidimicrobiia bacterium]|nr:amidohydrolase [Acidimicrobiia bacterium]